MWLVILCAVSIIAVLLWYGTRLERTNELQVRMENAQRIDSYMRSMFHEIYTRASTVEQRKTIGGDDLQELRAIIDASDMAMRLRSFYVMPDGEDDP